MEQIATREIVEMPVDEINTAHFNPPDRIRPNELRGLVASIKEYGILTPLAMSIEDNCLADGHRRLAAAKVCGLTTAPATWMHGSAAVLWSVLNKATKQIKGRDWWVASCREIAIATNSPRGMSNRLASLLRVLGPEDYEDMSSRRSPAIFTTAIAVARHVGLGKDEAFLRVCLLWLDKHDQQRPTIDALKADNQAPPQAFLNAIFEDRPLRMRKVFE